MATSTTARKLIRGSLRLLGAVASGENVEANEASDALDSLNGLLSSWSLERLLIYHVPRLQVPLIPGKRVYTWGPGGDIPGDRPLRLEIALIRDGLPAPGVATPPPTPEAPEPGTALTLQAVPGPLPLVATNAWKVGWHPLGVVIHVTEAFGMSQGLQQLAIGDRVQYDRWGYCELHAGARLTATAFLTGDAPWTPENRDLLVTPIGGAFDTQGEVTVTLYYVLTAGKSEGATGPEVAPPLLVDAGTTDAPVVVAEAWEPGWRQIAVEAEVVAEFGTSTGLQRLAIGDAVQFDRWGYCDLTAAAVTAKADFLTGEAPWTPETAALVVTPIGGAFDGTGQLRLTRYYLELELPPEPPDGGEELEPEPEPPELPLEEYPVHILTQPEYEQGIWRKSYGASGHICMVYLESSSPLARLHVWPVPTHSTSALVLFPWFRLTAVPTLDTLIDFPEGYERALRYGLAAELAPEYGVEVPLTVAAVLAEAKGNIKRINMRPLFLAQPIHSLYPHEHGCGHHDIRHGGLW